MLLVQDWYGDVCLVAVKMEHSVGKSFWLVFGGPILNFLRVLTVSKDDCYYGVDQNGNSF